MSNFLIYGANGYTGSLIAREAKRRGLRPVLAGRNGHAVTQLAEELQLEYRVFSLDNSEELDAALRQVNVVLHCSGPFSQTWKPMAEACLRTGTHYLDITGEISVFESLAALDAQAKEKGIMLLPGVGFDVVPTDCLAAHLKHRLPSATHLTLAIASKSRTSRGTAKTVLEGIDKGGLIRKEEVLKKVPAAWKTREIDFGDGPVKAITIPWGDISTAFYSTGIPNIEVYMAAPRGTRTAAKLLRYLGWLVRILPLKKIMKRRIQAGPPGPSDEERAKGWTRVWGEVTDDKGLRAVALLRGPEGYTFTAHTALAIVQRILGGQFLPGFQTPSLVYGANLILEIPGVERTDQ